MTTVSVNVPPMSMPTVKPTARYQRTRGGGGSPYASSHEITGLRSTPIPSISHSITSPGLRYQAFGSSQKAATPETVPVETTSPAL